MKMDKITIGTVLWHAFFSVCSIDNKKCIANANK